MAISFKEKRELQASLAANTARLRSGSLAFKEKRVLQTENAEILAKLRGGKAPVVVEPELVPEVNPRLAALLAGNYNNMEPQAFITLVGQIVEEIKDVQAVKPGILAYVAAAKADGRITESAAQELLETARG